MLCHVAAKLSHRKSQWNSDWFDALSIMSAITTAVATLGLVVTWKLAGAPARGEIRNGQLFLLGASFEMKYTDRGGAKHSRCMDGRNFT